MVFSTNQARQLYVVKKFIGESGTLANPGDIKVVKDVAGRCIYFEHVGAAGITRSDLIPIDSITYAKASDLFGFPTVTSYEVTLNTAVNSGNPVAGEHYILKVNYRQFVGMSDEDRYTEIAEALGGANASDLYRDLALNLVKNDAKQGLIAVSLGTSGAAVPVTADLKAGDLAGTYTKIIITAAEPTNWVRGKMPYEFAQFELAASAIVAGGLNVEPFTFTKVADTTSRSNGKSVADLEWFCMGERGDIYRGAGWPNNIETQYLVDPTKAYVAVDIHFAYQGTCEDIQKSEKDIILVADDLGELDDVSDAINTATGFDSEDPRYLEELEQS